MRSTILFTFFLFAAFQLVAQTSDYWIRSCNDNDECGYVNERGETMIPQGKYTLCFSDTFRTYGIVLHPEMGFVAIDRNEQIMYEVLAYDNGPDYVSDGLFRIVKDDKIGFANAETGAVVIESRFRFAEPFFRGTSWVCDNCDKVYDGEHYSYLGNDWYLLDTAGNTVRMNHRKTYSADVIRKQVTAIDKLQKARQLKKISYPEMSSCGGGLYGYSQKGKLQYIDATYGAEFGYSAQKVWFKDSSVIKIVLQEHHADYDAYSAKYPNAESFDEKLLTYHDKVTTIILTNPPIITQTFDGKKVPVDFTDKDLQKTLRCIDQMMLELWWAESVDFSNPGD